MNPVAGISTVLFVPGSCPDRFDKALASGADLICIDLEDAVAPDSKDAARVNAIEALKTGEPRLAIRINGLATEAGIRDLLALRETATAAILLLPMVESPRDVAIAAGLLAISEPRIVPLVESSAALREAHLIAEAPAVAGMMFGGGDLSAELGVELAWEPLAVARGQFVLACAGRGLALIDVPFVKLEDEAGLDKESALAKAAGFTAKAAIHPAQVKPIQRMFRPTEGDLAEAEQAIQAYRAGGGKAIRHGGRMLEAPVIRRYEAMLASRERLDA